MKPLTGWPRKGSVLGELRPFPGWEVTPWATTVRYFAGLDVPEPDRVALDNNREMFERVGQDIYTQMYRRGCDNVGLCPDVVQAIQWMHGTPQFLEFSNLQIVPVTDEQLAELELWLQTERERRAEQWYSLPVDVTNPYKPNFDTLG